MFTKPSVRRHNSMKQERAGDRVRTDDNNVGNVVLYQLSYTRDPNSNLGLYFGYIGLQAHLDQPAYPHLL